ncbi:MAG: UPF0182 family protein [Longimicrobiales bacterium]
MSDLSTKTRNWGRLLILLVVGLGALLLLARGLASVYTESLWYSSAGYASVYWTLILAEGGTRLAAGLFTALLAFVNFRVVARTLSAIQIKRKFGNLEIAERIPARTISWGVGIASLLMGLWVGASFPRGAGIRTLLFLKAPSWGLETPFLPHDVSFFVFALPILEGVLILGLALTFLLLSFSAAGYAATGSLTLRGGRATIAALPRKHLGVLAGLFLALLAGRFWLSPMLLLLDGNSGVQGIFGFADAQARIPAYRILAFLTASAGITTVWSGFKNKIAPLVGAGIAVLLGGLLLVQVYPEIVQRWQVEPNELARETRFIQANLRFTRLGFGLESLNREEFDYSENLPPEWGEAARQFAGLPIWTSGTLLTTFQEVDARYPYYDFENVVIDRYDSPVGVTPVAVAVREIDPGGIGDPNWQNLHLRPLYLAGMGAVASDVTRRTPQGRPLMFLSGIPPVPTDDPRAPGSLSLTDPSVYFGARPQLYAILNPGVGSTNGGGQPGVGATGSDPPSAPGEEEGIPVQEGAPLTPEVTGEIQGIRLNGLLRTLAYAWLFRDPNLLFASEVSGESLMIYRRSVEERARAIAPFLRFLEAPYPVIDEGRIVWVLEGFTTTRRFPLSTAQDMTGGSASTYVRNSVKVTVDGVTGETFFYRVDDEDPLLEAWSRVFPGVLRPLEEMPAGVRSHVRYPRSLLDLQARVLLQYHQDTAPAFHGQQDVWALPQELSQGTRPVPYRPEYGLYRLPGEPAPEFLLTTVFVPAGRQNLTAVLAARSDPAHYGELHLLDIAVEEQVPGPRQVEALVEQDPVISQQFSLWRQGGSQVWSGHLHVVPVGRRILYLEPIFLAAEADAIPELRRFVVSDGRRVAMEETLNEAISALAGVEGQPFTDLPTPETLDEETLPIDRWPQEALDLLDRAEERLRNGDWAGFGVALEELRALLGRVSGTGGQG